MWNIFPTAVVPYIWPLPRSLPDAKISRVINKSAYFQFDAYLRSLSLHDTEIKLVTDGQLPLRQCLHREASAKDLELPTYYNRFSDLRKEFLRYKSGDLAHALVPVKDAKKMLQAPSLPMPQSIAEMLGGKSCLFLERYILPRFPFG